MIVEMILQDDSLFNMYKIFLIKLPFNLQRLYSVKKAHKKINDNFIHFYVSSMPKRYQCQINTPQWSSPFFFCITNRPFN